MERTENTPTHSTQTPSIDWTGYSPIIIDSGGTGVKCLQIQMVSRSSQRIGLVDRGSQRGGGSRVERQFCHDRTDSIWYCGQRVERIQEFCHQDGHVSFHLHHPRKDFDRIAYVRARIDVGRI